MKKYGIAALFAAAVLLAMSFVPKTVDATPRFGYPAGYELKVNLNKLELFTQCNNPPQTNAIVSVKGTFVGGVNVYTSVNGTFSDKVQQGTEITAPTGTPVPVNLPAGTKAVRVINEDYTSGDIFVGLDCFGGQIVMAPGANPTPTPTPTPTPAPTATPTP